MLETLIIKNIATIESAEIPFETGLNILSGETGAGKSIVLESISLLLGNRAQTDLIRNNCDEAIVEGLFNVSQCDWIHDRLQKLGFQFESSQLLIKRVISRAGRHRIYVNGELSTLSLLQDLCEGLVDLCSQHEHQSLIKPNVQLELLDRFGNHQNQLELYQSHFAHHRALEREQSMLNMAEAEHLKKRDYLLFQANELKQAELQADEDHQLIEERTLLQSSKQRAILANQCAELLESEEAGVLLNLKLLTSKIRQIVGLDTSAQGFLTQSEKILNEIEDLSLNFSRYVQTIDLDPNRLDWVQDRIHILTELKKKYGSTVNEMLKKLSHIETALLETDFASDRLQEISKELLQLQNDLLKYGIQLSEKRNKAAALFSKSVTNELKDLKMESASFKVEIETKEEIQDWTALGPDQVSYLVRTNLGEPYKPLGKVASGGELSRLLLAIRRIISNRGSIGVYLFDEIDSGMGGQTAFEVGRKLKSVAAHNQVICITHLAQVSAFADHHIVVEKKEKQQNTHTHIRVLDSSDKQKEIARMLGGPKLTPKSLATANELLTLASTPLNQPKRSPRKPLESVFQQQAKLSE